MGHRQQVRRNVLFERQLGLKGRFGVGRQADAVRDAEDVRIDRHHLLLPQHRAQHVGRLAAHARQALHLLQIARNLAAELRTEHAGHAREVAGLVVGIGDALDVGVNILGRSRGHIEGRGKRLEQRGSGHVDPFVGALRRKDHRHQQLVGVGVVQFTLGHGHMLREPCDYAVVTLFGRHKCCFLRRKRIFFTRKIAPSGQKTSRGVRRRSAHQRARYSPTPAPFHESSQSPTT